MKINHCDIAKSMTEDYLDDYWYESKLFDLGEQIGQLDDHDFKDLIDTLIKYDSDSRVRLAETLRICPAERASSALETLMMSSSDPVFITCADSLLSFDDMRLASKEAIINTAIMIQQRSREKIDQSIIQRFIARFS